MDVVIINIVFFGKKYKLQHPGGREWLRLKQTMYKPALDQMDLESLLNYFFEHCCFPEEGEKLSLDSFTGTRDSMLEMEAWGLLAPRFFRGDVANGYIFPESENGKQPGGLKSARSAE